MNGTPGMSKFNFLPSQVETTFLVYVYFHPVKGASVFDIFSNGMQNCGSMLQLIKQDKPMNPIHIL